MEGGATNAVTMDRTIAWRTSAVQEDFTTLRQRREGRHTFRPRPASPLLGPLARWALAVVPAALSWLYLEVAYISAGYGLHDLAWRGAHLAATLGLLWMLLRAPHVERRGRVAGLMQVGLSAGVAVVGLKPAIASVSFTALFLLSIVLGAVYEPVRVDVEVVPFLLPVLTPVGVVLVCGSDGIRLVRRLREAPLGWRDCGWLLLGLLLSLPVALVALLPYWLMSGPLA